VASGMVAAETALATNAVVAKAVELFVAARVTPLVVPFSVVVLVPFAAPIVTLVVEPATPFVPISIVLVRPVAVAPDPKDKTDEPTPLPRPTLLLFAVIGPLNVVPPFNTIALVPIVLPTVTFVVEPLKPPVPIFTLFVFPVVVAPFPKPYIAPPVLFPIVMLEAVAVNTPLIVVLVPVVAPTVTLVVEPDAPPVPMFMVFVTPVAVGLFPILTVVAVVKVEPKLMSDPLNVLFPATDCDVVRSTKF
jgi:hypothetical protein